LLHLRIVVPDQLAGDVLKLLEEEQSACNLVHFPGAARRPDGDVILVDLAREDASVVLADLRDLDVDHHGSISVEEVDFQLSDQMDRAVKHAAGSPADAVVWEEVTSRTSETAELNWSFVLFMVLAGLIASVGILLDSPILVVGAMVVGPEYGPISALCVAAVRGRAHGVRVAGTTLLVAAIVGALATFVLTLLLHATGAASASYDLTARQLTAFSSHPDALAAVIAVLAGIAGMLSLTEGRSGVLVGVLVSATTIPAIANIGVAAAYGEVPEMLGSALQLAINVAGLVIAGVGTLWVQARLVARHASR
jgi:uncharacterized hydrophobic protein (TIGR00271 family)